MLSKDIRKNFLDYFENQGHKIIPSSSLIPGNDQTLLFTNAGMVQFKDLFLGIDKREYKRAVSYQKCVRAGGKHNDLEMVGRTARHHTFFEMLGNFSFGDYFKNDAIAMGWEFLTKTMKLPEDKLRVTIFRDDDDAYNIWHKNIKIPVHRIIRMGEADNFWSMGETGPCGPCSEIIIDQGEGTGCGRSDCAIGCGCDRYLELWNLVFMQFEKDKEGKMTPLPNPSIDTGMGLERLSAVIQGKKSNFDCDLIRPIIASLEDEFKKNYGDDEKDDFSLRVISDHIRASTFLIHDGVMPSNEGRGYVLRRIIRRGVRHAKMLGKDSPFLYRTVEEVINVMKNAYPELIDRHEYISKVILSEEERFDTTLSYGVNILDKIIQRTKKKKYDRISGEELFKLYDTYGFPLDIAEDMAKDAGLSLDSSGFEKAMKIQRETARASWKGGAEDKDIKHIYKKMAAKIKKLNFTGYKIFKEDVEVFAILKGDKEAEDVCKGEEVELIYNSTPFYGETGGQIGDTGKGWNSRSLIDITDTARPLPDLIVHKCKIVEGRLKRGDLLTVHVDEKKRKNIALNHSAAHLLHAALRQVLGDHVKQSGSLVSNDRLRFDYTHFSRISVRELNRVEEIVNEKIRENLQITTEQLDINEALKRGAIALFGEKYRDKVRMVQMGSYSIELCGGTHTNATGDIGMFEIIGDTGIASGIRRIEALTGETAYRYVKKEEGILSEIQGMVKAGPRDISEKVQKLIDYTKKLEREIGQIKQGMVNVKEDNILSRVKEINGISVLAAEFDNLDLKSLRSFIDNAKNKIKSGIIIVGTTVDSRVLLAAGVTKDLTGRFHAGNILKDIAAIVDGSGGGRADMAQAGGKDPSRLKEALEKIYEIVKIS